MKDRLGQQIFERAPWVFRKGFGPVRRSLMALLSYDRTLRLAYAMEHASADQIMDRIGRLIGRKVRKTGLEHIPEMGPALIVANHPTGVADAIILHRAIRKRRGDIYLWGCPR